VVGPRPFIGRTREIDDVFATVTGGHGVTVEGPAGIGKTSLVRRAASVLSEDPRFTAIPVSATKASQAIPLGALAGHLVGAPPKADDLARVQEALLKRSGEAKLLIVVDDGYLLDDFSAIAIHQLAVAGRALVLATTREATPASTAFDALLNEGLSERLVLRALDEHTVASIASAILGGPVDTHLSRTLWAASQGVPMAVTLLLESGVRSGSISEHHGLWTVSGTLESEPRLRTLIADQIERLSPAERSAVEVIALSEPLDAPIVDLLVPAQVIASLQGLGLVVGVDGETGPGVRLVHPLFGEAARHAITDSGRRDAIGALARAMNVSDQTDAETLLRVALWGAAADCSLDVDLLVRAAAVSRTRSVESQINLLQAALVAGAPAAVSLDLAQALTMAGRVDDAAAVLTDFDPAGLTPFERVTGATTRAMGLTWTLHRPGAALAMLGEERLSSGSDPVLHAMLDSAEATARLVAGDAAAAAEVGRKALAAPGIGDESVVNAATAAVVALGHLGQTQAAIEISRRWKEPAARVAASNPPLAAGFVAARWEVLDLSGELATLAGEAGAAFRRAVEVGDPFTRPRAAKALARLAFHEARPQVAAHHMRESLVALDGFDRMFISWSLAQLAEILAVAGDPEQARLVLSQSDEVGPIAPIFVADRVLADAAVLASEGQTVRAAEAAASGARAARRRGLSGQALRCWYAALRYGHADAARQIAALTSVEGTFALACRKHAAASADRSGAALDRAATEFRSFRSFLFAAEASREASAAHYREGRPALAEASFEQANALLDPADPVVTPALSTAPAVVAILTPREREVAQLAARGLSDRAIAEQLLLSTRTVETHLTRTYAKLGLRGRADLTAVYVQPFSG
jgi:DNA-binding CsgD family transcriptional regulator